MFGGIYFGEVPFGGETRNSIAYTSTLNDSMSISDTFSSLFIFLKIVSDTITTSDIFQTATTRLLADSFTVADSIIHGASKTFTEIISVIDTFTHNAAFGRTLSDDFIISETFASIKSEFVAFVDTITTSDTMSTVKGYFRSLADTLTMSDTISGRARARIFTDIATVSEKFQAFHNGILLIGWHIIAKATSLWNKIIKPDF